MRLAVVFVNITLTIFIFLSIPRPLLTAKANIPRANLIDRILDAAVPQGAVVPQVVPQGGVVPRRLSEPVVRPSEDNQEGEDDIATTLRPRKQMLRRKIIKVLTTTVTDEEDCKSQGGSPCTEDKQCCLGRCALSGSSGAGFCPTATQLFEAARQIKLREESKQAGRETRATRRPVIVEEYDE